MAALVFGLAGCGGGGDGGTFVLVTVSRGAIDTTGVKHVDLQLSFGGQMATVPVDSPSDLVFPFTKALEISSGKAGTLDITALAIKDGNTLSSGSASVPVVAGSTVNVTVTLGQVTSVDGGVDAGGALLSIDKTSHDFGQVLLGTSSAAATFHVRNTGTVATGTLSAVRVGDAFVLTGDCAGRSLAPNEECTATVTLMPSVAGTQMGTLTVSASPGGSVMATLSGEGLTPGALQLLPLAQDFGMVVQGGNSGTQTFTITNTGQAATGTIATMVTGSDAAQFPVTADGCNGQTLGANASCQITVRFSPSSPGAKSASLTLAATPGGTAVAQLSGTGLSIGNLTITPTSRDFGMIQEGLMGAIQVFTVQNTGGSATGMLTTAVSGTDAAAFSVSADGCMGMMLAANASCMVSVRFLPTTSGSKIATLTVSASPGGAAAAPLSGTALANPQLRVTPTTQDYAQVVVNTTANASFTVTNIGGVVSGMPAPAIAGTDAASYSVMGNTCTAALGPGLTCTVTVRFAPTTTGVKNATLTVSATPGGSSMATLTGTSIAQGALSVSPANFDYGSVLEGTSSTPHAFTVTNTGGSPTTALSTTIVGSTEFTIMTPNACAGQVLAAAQTCMINVIFSPASAGTKSGTLTVSAATGGTAPASLNGTGLAQARLVMSPTTFTFPTTLINATSTTQPFVITNTGGVAAGTTTALSTVLSPSPGDFDIVSNGCSGTLGAGLSCTIVMAFNPQASGARTASLTVNGAPGGSAAASLNGTGQTPANITLGGDSGNYNGVLLGSSAIQIFTATNGGQQATSSVTFTVTGADFAWLTGVAGDCVQGQIINGGASCNVRVQFTPSVAGARTGQLSFAATTGGGGPPRALSGTGQTPATLTTMSASPMVFGTAIKPPGSATLGWVIRNSGDVMSGAPTVPTISGTNAGDFANTTNGCTAALAPGATCTVTVTFTPQGGGARTAINTITASPGGSLALTMNGSATPAAPTNVQVCPGVNRARVFWNPAVGATSYSLYYSTATPVNLGTATRIANASSPTVVTGLSPGTTYYFVVTASNAVGESLASTQGSAAGASIVAAGPADDVFVANFGGSIDIFDNYASLGASTTAPTRRIAGGSTGINQPTLSSVVVDKDFNDIYVANRGAATITMWHSAATVNGDVAPTRTVTITGVTPESLAYDPIRGRMYISRQSGTDDIYIIDAMCAQNGTITPSATMNAAALGSNVRSIYVDASRDILYAATGDTTPRGIAVFDSVSTITAVGTTRAHDRLVNLTTEPVGPVYAGVSVDEAANRLYIGINNGNLYSVAGASTANGTLAPTTQLTSFSALVSFAANNILFSQSDCTNQIRAWNSASTATGATAPSKTMSTTTAGTCYEAVWYVP